MVNSWSPEDHIRHFPYEAIHKVLAGLPWEERTYRCLDFPGKWYGDEDGGWRTHMRTMFKALLGKHRLDWVGATYPEVDIVKMPYPDGSFDVAVADQVLEHVERPWVAADELLRVVKPGGICVVATPGLYPVHPSPVDCWRLLPDGYKVIFPESRWQHLALDMWGTVERVGFEYAENRAFPYGPPDTTVEQAMAQPFYTPGTDGRGPLQVWFIGRKR